MGGKVTIHSDGTPQGTVVITEDGIKLEQVTEAAIYLDARDMTRVNLTMAMVPIIVEGQIERWEFICPVCEEKHEHECNGKNSSMASDPFLPTQVAAPTLANPTATISDLPATGQICGKEVKYQDPAQVYTCWVLDSVKHDTHVDITQGVAWEDTPPYSMKHI